MEGTLTTIFSFVIMVLLILKNRKTLKKLTKFQIVGVGVSYLFAILIAFIFIYYGGNWIADQFSNTFFKYMIFLAVVYVSLSVCKSILNKVLERVTNGILPKS